MNIRILVAGIVLAGSLAGAMLLRDYVEVRPYPEGTIGLRQGLTIRKEPKWADPAALALAVLGVTVAAATIAPIFLKRRD